MNKKRNSPHAWPYVIAGSVTGGALGYLFGTETGQKIRRGFTHPDEMLSNIKDARTLLESKTRPVADEVHEVMQKAKHGIEKGQRAYEETSYRLHSQTHAFHGKTVENINRTAVVIEQNVVHPIVELGALVRGIEHGLRTFLVKERKRPRRKTYEIPSD
jgi:hypothetical protein